MHIFLFLLPHRLEIKIPSPSINHSLGEGHLVLGDVCFDFLDTAIVGRVVGSVTCELIFSLAAVLFYAGFLFSNFNVLSRLVWYTGLVVPGCSLCSH